MRLLHELKVSDFIIVIDGIFHTLAYPETQLTKPIHVHHRGDLTVAAVCLSGTRFSVGAALSPPVHLSRSRWAPLHGNLEGGGGRVAPPVPSVVYLVALFVLTRFSCSQSGCFPHISVFTNHLPQYYCHSQLSHLVSASDSTINKHICSLKSLQRSITYYLFTVVISCSSVYKLFENRYDTFNIPCFHIPQQLL